MESEGPREAGAAAAADRSCEIASVLFTDIVSYSVQPIDRQSELLTSLQGIVKHSTEFQQARARDGVITLPTGDGMALVFFGDAIAPVRCALEIAEALRARPELKLRMGIHSGPVFRHADIKDELNVVGGGINMAQRVMDCGDAGHILASGNVAEVLQQLSAWRDWVHDLGTFEVKHGVKVHVYNLYKEELGRPEPPRKQPAAAQAKKSGARRWILPGLAAAVLVAAVGTYYWSRTPVQPPVAPAPERTLSYYFMVQKYRDHRPYQQPFRVSRAYIFESDYRIRLFFSSPQPGYLYILNEGPESTPQRPVFNTLFPSPTANNGSALLSAGAQLQIPAGGPIVFDNEKGVEKLWLVWSKQALPALDALERWANPRDRGSIADPAQLRALVSFLAQAGRVQPQIGEDEACRCTVVKGRSETLVSLLKLEHE